MTRRENFEFNERRVTLNADRAGFDYGRRDRVRLRLGRHFAFGGVLMPIRVSAKWDACRHYPKRRMG